MHCIRFELQVRRQVLMPARRPARGEVLALLKYLEERRGE